MLPHATGRSETVLEKAKAQVRYRRALRSQVASKQDAQFFSRFGGLWTDRRDAGEQHAKRRSEGTISESDADRVRDWIAHGYVVLEGAVHAADCDRLSSELAEAFTRGDERLLANTRGSHLPEYLFSGKYKHWNPSATATTSTPNGTA
jgi:hypothetical protein